jgi:archaemetzincin
MKTILQILVVVGIIYFVCINNTHTSDIDVKQEIVDENDYSKLKNNTFYIKGLGNVSPSVLKKIANTIERFYGFTTIIDNSIGISEDLYIKNTTEILDATICLEKLDNHKIKVIYITEKQLWSLGDYVNGLAYQDGNTVIVSTQAHNLIETVKHEIGHTFGLSHCSEITCVMASRNDRYETGEFCEKCKKHFKNKFNLK